MEFPRKTYRITFHVHSFTLSNCLKFLFCSNFLKWIVLYVSFLCILYVVPLDRTINSAEHRTHRLIIKIKFKI